MFENIKVVLVSPSSEFLCDPLGAEPLGLMYIEGVLRQLEVDVEMVDMSFDTVLPAADIYGFYASSVNYYQVIEYAKQVKPAYAILGGPHASALPKEAKEHFDAVVIGPGEGLIEQILKDFAIGEGGIYKGSIPDIDSIHIPHRSILKRIKYSSVAGITRTANIISARGCPFKCAFCSSNTIWGRSVQFRSIDNIVNEIIYLRHEYDIHHFKIVDDTFTLNKPRFRELAEVLSGLDISWKCNTRVDTIDDEILDYMIRSNCFLVELGVESVDNDTLARNRKSLTIEQAKQTIAMIKARGLKVKLFLIYGLPFEPADIVRKTIEFIEDTEPDSVTLSTFVPFPGTDIWNNPQDYNVKRIYKDFSQYQLSVGGFEKELAWLPNIEYNDRPREKLRAERNVLKRFALLWNKDHA